ncbi:MAG TPA: FHA domain-containing protein [Spirochaetota bacterium]|nr:FHA domain-containing protein [Spirochaetota bacterium]HRZ25232.1 FHA domain-containing protein [Spirochaetota bacterium]
MSSLKRRFFLCLIGALAGLCSWSAAEMIMVFQKNYPSYLFFSIFLGAVFGAIIGGFFGSSDGIIMKGRIMRGVVHGMIIGSVGGVLGFLVGQGALFVAGEYLLHSVRDFRMIGFPVSRALGWSLLGLFAGMAEGVRSRSLEKIRIGIIGGITGGLIGGLALEYLKTFFPDMMLGRLTGLLIFGLVVGFMYGLVEARLSFGVLTLLNGRFRGKDFLINQRRIRLGAGSSNDVDLNGYRNIDERHAEITAKRDELFIKADSGDSAPVYVNDDKVKDHKLKIGDVIKIGSAKLLYHYK